jgi:segregation and condensation protein A
MPFHVELADFRGPLDLLLFLVRKHELEIIDLAIAPITEQFLQYLEVLKELDVDGVGDFVDMASTLMEIKSRSLLPRSEQEIDEPLEDPRADLVRKLLEYKRYKDAAAVLEERGRQWQQRFGRLAADEPIEPRDLAEQPIREVELWDLVSAFGRILREQAAAGPSNIVYDETPIAVYMERIHAELLRRGRLAMSELFRPYTNRSTLVGLFVATLELVRHRAAHVEQNDLFEEIWILPGEAVSQPLAAPTTSYEQSTDSTEQPAGEKPPRKRRGRGGKQQ